MSYTGAALLGVAAAAALDLAVLRTVLLRRRAFWTAYAILLFFQLVTNGVLTGRRIVRYDADAVVGLRVAYAPVEDLLFGFALVLSTLALWVWWGRRQARQDRRRAAAARTSPGSATAARRPGPTRTRRSSTR